MRTRCPFYIIIYSYYNTRPCFSRLKTYIIYTEKKRTSNIDFTRTALTNYRLNDLQCFQTSHTYDRKQNTRILIDSPNKKGSNSEFYILYFRFFFF